tara:strand:- start:237 stop:428 length:192 start_codon:yes stop_codon:yes gene_type:complete
MLLLPTFVGRVSFYLTLKIPKDFGYLYCIVGHQKGKKDKFQDRVSFDTFNFFDQYFLKYQLFF